MLIDMSFSHHKLSKKCYKDCGFNNMIEMKKIVLSRIYYQYTLLTIIYMQVFAAKIETVLQVYTTLHTYFSNKVY